MLADNAVGVYLNNNFITAQSVAGGGPTSNFRGPATPFATSSFFKVGTNVLDFIVADTSAPYTAVDFSATIRSSSSVQPGITCSGADGTMSFRPPLTDGGTRPEVATLRADLGACSVRGGNSTPRDSLVTLSLNVSSNNCARFSDDANQTKKTNHETLKYGTKYRQTKVTFPGTTATTPHGGSGKQLALNFGGSGTTATGSYVGDDGGALSTATFVTTGTTGNLVAVGCTQHQTKIGKLNLGYAGISVGRLKPVRHRWSWSQEHG